MTVILVFIAFVFVGDAIALGISAIVENFSETASLLVFLGLFIGVFIVSWLLAVKVTERYLVQRRAS
jgi:hypothetical protein